MTASSDSTATVWDVNTGRELARFNHEGAVLSAVFTPDGRHVITASADHTARIWDVASGRELQRLQRANLMRQAAVAPDGRRILTVADDAGSLWNVSNLDATSKDLAREVCKWLPKEQRQILMAQATQSGPSGGTAAVNYTLVIDPDATDPVQLTLPAAEFEENVSVSYKTRSPSVFVFHPGLHHATRHQYRLAYAPRHRSRYHRGRIGRMVRR